MSNRFERRQVQISFAKGTGRTHSEFTEDADINRIVGKWRETGFPNNVQLHTPVYADFSNAADYLTSLNKLKAADAIFDSLPARVRRRVDNDPAKLIALVEDPANADELRELGLVKPVEPTPAVAAAEPAIVGGQEIPPGGAVPVGPTANSPSGETLADA